MNNNDKRFEVKLVQSLGWGEGDVKIIVDNKTGVNYIITERSGISAMTPLIDSNGKPLVDKFND